MKRNDFILAGAMFIVALVWFIINNRSISAGSKVNVYKNNMLIESYLLSEDGDHTIRDNNDDKMYIVIKDGYCNVTWADCPDKLCVFQKKISKINETIVCLPNKIVVQITDDDTDYKGEFDAVTY